MLFAIPTLDATELTVLNQVLDLKKELQSRLSERGRSNDSLPRMTFARAIQGSNAIEGYSAELDDVAAIGMGEEPLDIDEETALAVADYWDAMMLVLELADEPTFTFTEDLLKRLHFMMLRHSPRNRPGEWRVDDTSIRKDRTGETVYRGPDAEEVPGLMHELCNNLNDARDCPALILAGMAHLNLVTIHPFRDGNGRMARCLQNLVLARDRLDPFFLSIEEYLGANVREYYGILREVGGRRWQPHRDARPWIRFILTAHLRQAKTILHRIEESELLWERLKVMTQSLSLPDRAIPPLFEAAMRSRVRKGDYRAIFDGSTDRITEKTTSRDLRQLERAGLLIAHRKRGRRYYVRSGRLAREAEAIVSADDPRDESDPFESPV